jgi:hypothetical protein
VPVFILFVALALLTFVLVGQANRLVGLIIAAAI